jgi:hypothetical protein
VFWVEGEVAELGAVEGEDSDLEASDEHDDAPAGVGAADADVVEAAVVAEGELAAGVDAVVVDAVAGAVNDRAAWVGAFSGGEREPWGSPVPDADWCCSFRSHDAHRVGVRHDRRDRMNRV